MDFQKAEQYIRQLLQTQLSPVLTYHDYDHTMDVVSAAEALAIEENITDPTQITLLKTAALFHDCGYVNVYEQHEKESCHIAMQVLPGFGYTNEQVQLICDMIMKTCLDATPQTHLEKILVDADLDYLGGEQFEARGQKLFSEWIAYGKLRDEKEWNEKQIRFLESHRFFTQAAISRGEKRKAEYLRKLKHGVNA